MHSPEPGRDAAPDMFSPSQIRLLKFAVIAMGALLLAGFITVIGRIVYLVNSGPAPATGTGQIAAAVVPTAIALPTGAVVRNLSLSGSRLAIHYEAPAGAGILVVDLAGGPAATLPIVSGAAVAPPAKATGR